MIGHLFFNFLPLFVKKKGIPDLQECLIMVKYSNDLCVETYSSTHWESSN